MKFKKICAMGLGYIGPQTTSAFATNGLKVGDTANGWRGADWGNAGFKIFRLGGDS
jgi:hypothetical protein